MIIDKKCNVNENKQIVSFYLIKDNCIELNQKLNSTISCQKCLPGQF